ncbi:MAG: hypothetical protein RML95_08755 [Anaerolineae bacterium]|nr:hypothetical protein [Anaerolineae bacterium]
MAKQSARTFDPIPYAVALAALLIGVASATFFVSLPDDRLIIARYAAQLRETGWLVFNQSEKLLLIPAPLLMIAQAYLGAELTFGLSLALGAACLYELGRFAALTQAFRLLAAGIFALAYPLWIGAGTPYPLMTALALLGLLLVQRGAWRLAGIVFGLAALCSVEALVLVLLMLLYAAQHGKAWRFTQTFGALLGAALIALWLYYGSFWEGLLTFRRASPPAEDSLSVPLIALLLIAALPTWWRARREPFVALLGAWIALYVGILGGVFRLESGYAYAPIVPAAALLASRLFQRAPIMSVIGVGVTVGACVIALSGSVMAQTSPERIPVPPEARSIAVSSKDMLFRQAWRLDQRLIALDGTLQPNLRRFIERGDLQSALVFYAPDILHLASADDDWRYTDTFEALSYAPYQSEQTFRRQAAIALIGGRGYAANKAFSPDLFLSNVFFGVPDKRADKPVARFELWWEVQRPASRPVTIEIQLGEVSQRTEFPASVFSEGKFKTYHALPVSSELTEDFTTLRVRAGVNNGWLGEVVIERVDLRGVTN